ncbi:MAG: VWA domain-containing protein [Hyphomicrobiaceae bacterium]
MMSKKDGTTPRHGRKADRCGDQESQPGQRVPQRRTGTSAKPPDKDVAEFLAQLKSISPVSSAGRGRLVFAMDATMSRQATWDMALGLQAEMFRAVKQIGDLDIQLVYFRGAGECRASKWVSNPDALSRLMTTVHCAGGFTQIGKVLTHTTSETKLRKVSALVYVGDCMEEEVDVLCGHAGELAIHGVPVFIFQEGSDQQAELAFREIARLTKGAYCRFNTGAAAQLRELLSAVAVYAAGGRAALSDYSQRHGGRAARLLIEQMKS